LVGFGVGFFVGLGLTLGEADGDGTTEGEAPAWGTAARVELINRFLSIQ
jgi:hypothetical protein